MKKFEKFTLRKSELVFGGEWVSTDTGMPGTNDYYNTETKVIIMDPSAEW